MRIQRSKSISSRTAQFEKPKTSCTEVSDPSTTVLSPYLSIGCISPRTVWHAIETANKRAKTNRTQPPVSLHGQLLWRDFNNLMAHSANSQHAGSWGQIENNAFCRDVPWSSDPNMLSSWKEGRTGCEYLLPTQPNLPGCQLTRKKTLGLTHAWLNCERKDGSTTLVGTQ